MMSRFLESIKSLKELYPAPLLLLVFAPFLIGCFIDIELSDSRYISINLIWLSLFTIPAALFKSKWLYRFTILVYFICGFVEITHWIIIKGPLTITSIMVLTNSNSQEAMEFFDLKASAGLFVLIPYVLLFFYAFKKVPKYQKRKWIIAGIILLGSTVFITENAVNGRFIRKATPQIVKVSLSFLDQIELYHQVREDVSPRKVSAKAIFPSKQQTFVLIIGESTNRNHMSLYGASRITTPKLDKRDDLMIFDNVVSPYSNTINSVLSILSESNLENKISFKNSVDILDVFSSAGFKTYWLSNQPPMGVWENRVTVFAKKADQQKFVNMASNSSMEATLTSSHDSKLFAPLDKVLKEEGDKKLIVLHLMGSHSFYGKRYPPRFNVFKGSNDKEKTIAQYDNSVLYGDHVVDSILDMVKEYSVLNPDAITSAIYLSDHGENVYDEQDRVGHDYSNKLPKANVEIPFLVWTSQSYSTLYPEKEIIFKSNLHKPFVSDDLFHSILDINGIESEYLERKRSLFIETLDTNRNRVLEDGKDYDVQ